MAAERLAGATAAYPARDWCGHPRTVEGWCPLDVALATLGADPATLVVRGQGAGGYASQGEARGRANAAREAVWFSPGCVPLSRLQLALPGWSDLAAGGG